MTIATAPGSSVDAQPLLLDVSNTTLTVTPEQFDRLCIDNPDLRLELTPDRQLIVMAPTGGESGQRNADLVTDVNIWNRQTDLGRVFDSSTGYDFTALDGGKRSPDVSWIEKSRLEGVDIKGFITVVPDFVIELRSATDDSLTETQTKMRAYQQLGVRLGLLIDPQNRKVEIYRSGQEPEILELPESIDCSDIMPGFVLNMNRIW
ncbi:MULTISPECIES: Uma2 family endonuclease [unclassified Chamaesiphon]|uniref:Uma2 family endonuclease n=1 Tax=unclassified Chamaesiphon TaxID=2620921 RepID=UPI00286B32F3|nr:MULTISPECIES: Uma2 family endonuclease [unclassified Chamaesiphon]